MSILVTKEKRQGERILVDIPVKIIVSNEKSYLAQVININKGGFLCLMKKSLPIKSRVRLMLLLPPNVKNFQSQKLTGEGMVIREHIRTNIKGDLGHAVVIQFTKVCQKELDSLNYFLHCFSKTA